jgi:hypothetical protein
MAAGFPIKEAWQSCDAVVGHSPTALPLGVEERAALASPPAPFVARSQKGIQMDEKSISPFTLRGSVAPRESKRRDPIFFRSILPHQLTELSDAPT